MARSKSQIPSYILHRKSGRGRLCWTDPSGLRREVLLPGKFKSSESLTAKARLELELATAPHRQGRVSAQDQTVAEVLLAYIAYAEAHYRGPNGEPTGESERIKAALKPVRLLYAHLPADEFGPLALKTVRQQYLILGWCRRSINHQIERVRRCFKWAAAEQLISFATYQALTTLVGLKRGRTTAPEPEPIGPVDEATVEATLPHLNQHVRGLIRFQQFTGCRPGEACRVRRCDIDTGGAIWLYRPPQHKGSWRGKPRTIAIGPKLQELLLDFFTADIHDYLFSPRRAVEELRAQRAAKRKTPRYPSHENRNASKRKANPNRVPDERYDSRSYSVAVARACEVAHPLPDYLQRRTFPKKEGERRRIESRIEWWKRLTAEEKTQVREWREDHRWHPNQLRHAHGTRVRKLFSLEHAGAALGHSKMSATEIYAERDAGLLEEVALKIG